MFPGSGMELEAFMRINKKLLLSFLFAFVLGLAFVPVCPDTVWAGIPTENVDYIDEDGVVQHDKVCTLISAAIDDKESGGTLSNDWYVVDKDWTVNATITVSGTVNLVLKDGCTLTVTGASDKAGINVGNSSSLKIFGQSGGSGTLVAKGGNRGAGIGGGNSEGSGTVGIFGGVVTAIGGDFGAGIGGGNYKGCGIVIISGGTVTATGGLNAAGIGGGVQGAGGNVTIKGGMVTATGGGSSASNGEGIGAGLNGSDRGSLIVGTGDVVRAGDSPNPTKEKTHGSGGAITLSGERYYTVNIGSGPVTPTNDSTKSQGNTIYRVVIAASGDDYICYRQGSEPDEREYIDYDAAEFNLSQEEAQKHYLTLTQGENSRFLQGFVCHLLKGYLQELALQDVENKTVVFDNLDTTYEIHLVSAQEFQIMWNE